MQLTKTGFFGFIIVTVFFGLLGFINQSYAETVEESTHKSVHHSHHATAHSKSSVHHAKSQAHHTVNSSHHTNKRIEHTVKQSDRGVAYSSHHIEKKSVASSKPAPIVKPAPAPVIAEPQYHKASDGTQSYDSTSRVTQKPYYVFLGLGTVMSMSSSSSSVSGTVTGNFGDTAVVAYASDKFSSGSFFQFGGGYQLPRVSASWLDSSALELSYSIVNGIKANGIRTVIYDNVPMGNSAYQLKTSINDLLLDYVINFHAIAKNLNPFAEVGLGFAQYHVTSSESYFSDDPVQPESFDKKNTNIAYDLGFGLGYHFSQKFAAKLGYRYLNQGKINAGSPNWAGSALGESADGALASSAVNLSSSLSNHEIYARVEYHF